MNRPLVFAICALTAGMSIVVRSAPIWNYPQTLTQPDGSVIHCFASGDEFNHWLHDKGNYTIVRDATTGYFVYAVTENDRLAPSAHIVGRVDPQSVGLKKGVHDSPELMTQRRSVLLQGRRTAAAMPFKAAVLNDIVIFIRFADESPGIFPDSISIYEEMFNSPVTGANSMYNYYQEVSYGQLAVSATFYPPATDSVLSFQDQLVRDYYRPYSAVSNRIGYSSYDDANAREQALLQRAIEAVAPQIPAGLDFDMDGDGLVDNVTFIVSGDPEAWSDWILWPHAWQLGNKTAVINGKRVMNYDLQLRGFLFWEHRGVTVLCHEMFHCLGAPDLYNYGKHGEPDELFPVWIWDIMGCKNQPNPTVNPPQHMSAYMKYRYGGWIKSIPTISAPGTYKLAPLTSSTSNCFKIPSLISPLQFYVVEYRRRIGTFESSLPGEGLLVYRINTTCAGNGGGPPDEVYVYRPGGTLTANGTPDSAAYSANSGRVALTDSTDPFGFLANGSRGGLDLTDVGFLGDTITFKVNFPTQPILSIDTRSMDLRRIFNTLQSRDTTFMVRNIGFAMDSIDVSLNYGNVAPDSAIAVSPTLFALAEGDSQGVTFTVRPQLLIPQYYGAVIRVHSWFGYGTTLLSKPIQFQIVVGTDVLVSEKLPAEFTLDHNYPNPFNPSTTIRYGLPGRSRVALTVFNTLGQQVATLVQGEQEAGFHEAVFDAAGLASGVYLYRLQAGDFIQTKRLVLVR
jgi:M6 family metalloprotease-like protein